jgi:hypothetical protein
MIKQSEANERITKRSGILSQSNQNYVPGNSFKKPL